jgi:hypothetical protein
MAGRTPRQVIDAYNDAVSRADWTLLREVLADDYVEDYLQSGERIVGPENAIRVRAMYPRDDMSSAPSPLEARLIVGGEERWALAPNFTAIRASAVGVTITRVVRAIYPDGPWYVVFIGTVAGGHIHHSTVVFGKVFDPPDWRAHLVQRMPEAER